MEANERAAARGRGARHGELLAALDRISLAALESRTLDELLPRLLGVLVDAGPSVDTAAILLREGERLVVRAAVGLEEAARSGFSVALGEGFAGRIAAERRPLLLRDAANDPLVVSPAIRARGVRALCGVPLVAGGELLGVAHVGSLGAYEFSDAERILFTALTERATAGIRLHQLREEADRRGRELERAAAERTQLETTLYARVAQLTAVAEAGIRALRTPLPALLDGCAAHVAETLGAELVMVTERTEDGAGLHAIAGVGWEAGVVGEAVLDAGAGSLAGFTISSREPAVSDDYPADPRFAPVPFILEHGARSGVAAVIEAPAAGAPFGVLAAFSRRPRAFSRDDAAFVQSVANVLAAAVEKDRSESRVRDDLTFLAQASHALSATLEVEATVAAVARIAVPRLGDWCAVDVRVGGGWTSVVWHADAGKRALGERFRAAASPAASHGAPEAVRTGRTQFLPELGPEVLADLAGSPEALALVATHPPRSLLAVPLVTRGRTVGAISFATEGDRRLRDDDVQLAEELARHAALAIDNAWLYAESQRAVRDRDDVIGIVSHDLRSPLNGIALAAAALEPRLADAGAGPAARRQLAVIQRSADRMARLIRDLLDMARIRAGRLVVTPAEADAAELLDEALHFEALAAEEKGIRLERRGGAGPLPATLDRDRVQQVLTNLLGNAIKFTPPGGAVTASVEAAEGGVRFTVADTGAGIAPGDAARIFDAYWTRGDAARSSGAGLGLFISRGIVEAHGGRIGVTTAAGAGATFWFELPRAVTGPRPTPTGPAP